MGGHAARKEVTSARTATDCATYRGDLEWLALGASKLGAPVLSGWCHAS